MSRAVALKTTRFINFSARRCYADEEAILFYMELDAYERGKRDDDERANARLQRMKASKERALLIRSLKKKRGLGGGVGGSGGFVSAWSLTKRLKE